MSDATVRNFCKYQCVMSFQSQYSKTPLVVEGESFTRQDAVPTGAPRKYMGQKTNGNIYSFVYTNIKNWINIFLLYFS